MLVVMLNTNLGLRILLGLFQSMEYGTDISSRTINSELKLRNTLRV